MTPEQKKRWTDALRSGKYEQGRTYLNRDDKLCCLGVACEVFGEELGLKKEKFEKVVNYGDQVTQLPLAVADLLGIDWIGSLPVAIPHPEGATPFYNLANLNDRAKYTFSQIADVIEEQF